MTESRNGKKEKQIILRLMLHLLGCQKERKIFASSGNRTRAARVAGEHSTTEPTMLAGCKVMLYCNIYPPGKQLWPSG